MNDYMSSAHSAYDDDAQVAKWLQQIVHIPQRDRIDSSSTIKSSSEHLNTLELLTQSDYHLPFYQQLPDFVMALLQNDSQVELQYAPLLYHLAGCRECHSAYLDLYDAMSTAIQPQGQRSLLGQGTRTLAATPHRMLAHLCQSLISQAEAILRQARHERANYDASARSLLQLAIQISAHISQSTVRRQALQDLVRVATLFDGHTAPDEASPDVYAYTPAVTGTGHMRRGRTTRRSETTIQRGQEDLPALQLQSHSLEGSIVQKGQTLELHLHDLAETLRGRVVLISILLGSLIEPIRWHGGNPRAIRSTNPVDAHGVLITPLGQTDLHIENNEERNLLEAIFLLLEVRALD